MKHYRVEFYLTDLFYYLLLPGRETIYYYIVYNKKGNHGPSLHLPAHLWQSVNVSTLTVLMRIQLSYIIQYIFYWAAVVRLSREVGCTRDEASAPWGAEKRL